MNRRVEPSQASDGRSVAGWSLLIVLIGATAWGSRFFFAPSPPSAPALPEIVTQNAEPPPTNTPIDWDAWRKRAWTKIEPRLVEADAAADAALVEELATIDEFFRERIPHSRAFAEEVLSLSGKWTFVKSKLPTADDDAHLRYLNEKFEQHVFRVDDLRAVVESAVGGYLSRVEGIENQLLVNVRADLSSGELGVDVPPRFVTAAEEFRRRYDTLLSKVAADVAGDFNVGVGRELTSLVAGEVGAAVAVRIASAVASRLGMSAGVLGAGAASGWATFGVGLVAAVVIDVALNKVIRAAGYDPVEKVQQNVEAVLGQARGLIVDGDPDAVAVYEKLRRMQTDDPDPTVRAECRASADKIEIGGHLGLRRELKRLQTGRSIVRREALRRLVFDGEIEQ